MGDKIALGFHACVDFELKWDLEKLKKLITAYNIQDKELKLDLPIDSERQLLLAILAHMKNGMGVEFVPETSEICVEFAQHFEYEITVGGTAARAAAAISKIGYESALSMVCCNRHIKERLPKGVHYYSNIGEGNEHIYPHVVFSYPKNVCVKVGGIDFVTPRENRVLLSRDDDSLNMVISQGFAPKIKDAEVMLVSCFSEVLEEDILKERMVQVDQLLQALPETAFVIMEDGCYVKKNFRVYVHEALSKKLNVLSMNEDEMQEYIGRRINIMEPKEVLEAIQFIYERVKIPLLIVHSAAWAVAYGKEAESMGHVLEGGINMAATRFRYGDDFGVEEYKDTAGLSVKIESIAFGREIKKLADQEICCIPCKDLSFVENPVVVGLGDYFAGGLLPELTVDRRIHANENDKKEG